MSTDTPTLLSPPIVLDVAVRLTPADEVRAMRHINALHGRPDGVPLDQVATPEHVDAACAVVRGKTVRLLVDEIDVAGNWTVRLAGDGERETEVARLRVLLTEATARLRLLVDADLTVYVNTRTGESVTLVTRPDSKRVILGNGVEGAVALHRMLKAEGSCLPAIVECHKPDGSKVVGLVESLTTTYSPSVNGDVEVAIVLRPWTLPPRPLAPEAT
jgi:hypothetical protein